ncbi:flagellar basal body rod protein FlgB [Lachnospiraceae bacterium 42-17]|jgi:flagellar basal-body rod protein FlgB|nr:flagellar basal body rod protein FlgB [Dorea sp.]
MFGNTIAMAEKSLDCLWKKQEAINNNLANIDTPGYKRKQVSFEETYRKRLLAASETKSDKKIKEAIQGMNYTVSSRDDSARVDENNVNADVENTEMTRTWLHYYYLLQSVTSDIKMYQTAIKGQ